MRRHWLSMLALLLVGGFCTTASTQEKTDPEFAAWYYPGATSIGSSTFSGRLHQVLLTTPDDVAKVEKFLLKKTDHPFADKLDRETSPPPFGIHTSLGYPHPKDNANQVFAIWGDDSKTKTDGDPRSMTMRTMVYETDDQLVTATVSRTPTEKTTHIVLTYLKKKQAR